MDSTAKQNRRLLNAAELLQEGNTAVIAHLVNMEEKVDEATAEMATLAENTRKDLSAMADQAMETIDARVATLKDGTDYILTEQDKADIAASIKVPVVEKVIEKTSVIHEQPVEIVKEVAVFDPQAVKAQLPTMIEPIRDGLELLEGDNRLDRKAIRGLTISLTPPENPQVGDIWIQG